MSKFVEGKEAVILPICNNCEHHINGLECKAFNVIPDSIIFGKSKHERPFKDQKGIFVFTESEALQNTPKESVGGESENIEPYVDLRSWSYEANPDRYLTKAKKGLIRD